MHTPEVPRDLWASLALDLSHTFARTNPILGVSIPEDPLGVDHVVEDRGPIRELVLLGEGKDQALAEFVVEADGGDEGVLGSRGDISHAENGTAPLGTKWCIRQML